MPADRQRSLSIDTEPCRSPALADIDRQQASQSVPYAGALKNCVPQLGKSIESCLAVEMAAAWHRLKRSFQAVGYLLRTRQWNVGIVITCPATAHASFSLANTGPIERFGKE